MSKTLIKDAIGGRVFFIYDCGVSSDGSTWIDIVHTPGKIIIRRSSRTFSSGNLVVKNGSDAFEFVRVYGI